MIQLFDKKHCSLRVQMRYWAVDSWDGGEAGLVWVDGNSIFNNARSDPHQCTAPWTSYGGAFPNPWSGARSQDVCFMDIDTTLPHTGNSVVLAASSTIDQTAGDESWAISNVVVTTNPCL